MESDRLICQSRTMQFDEAVILSNVEIRSMRIFQANAHYQLISSSRFTVTLKGVNNPSNQTTSTPPTRTVHAVNLMHSWGTFMISRTLWRCSIVLS